MSDIIKTTLAGLESEYKDVFIQAWTKPNEQTITKLEESIATISKLLQEKVEDDKKDSYKPELLTKPIDDLLKYSAKAHACEKRSEKENEKREKKFYQSLSGTATELATKGGRDVAARMKIWNCPETWILKPKDASAAWDCEEIYELHGKRHPDADLMEGVESTGANNGSDKPREEEGEVGSSENNTGPESGDRTTKDSSDVEVVRGAPKDDQAEKQDSQSAKQIKEEPADFDSSVLEVQQTGEDFNLDLDKAQGISTSVFPGKPIFKVRKGTSTLFLLEEESKKGKDGEKVEYRYRLQKSGHPDEGISLFIGQQREHQQDDKGIRYGKPQFRRVVAVAWEEYTDNMNALASIAFEWQGASRIDKKVGRPSRKSKPVPHAAYPWTRCLVEWADKKQTWETRTFVRKLFATPDEADETIWVVAYQREKLFCMRQGLEPIHSNDILDLMAENGAEYQDQRVEQLQEKADNIKKLTKTGKRGDKTTVKSGPMDGLQLDPKMLATLMMMLSDANNK